jgi:hypothetical protein
MNDNLYNIISEYSNKGIMVKLRYDNDLKDNIIKETSFLYDDATLSERVYCIKNHITKPLLCPYCSKPRKFYQLDKGYHATCGDKACKSQGIAEANKRHDIPKAMAKLRETYKQRTGYEHNMQNPEFRKQYFDNIEKKTGERYHIASEKSKINREKSMLSKYGTTAVGDLIKNKEVQESIIEKYGSLDNFYKCRGSIIGKSRKENDLNRLIEKLDSLGYEYIDSFYKELSTEYMHIKCKRCGNVFEVTRRMANIYYNIDNKNFCPFCDIKEMLYRSNFEKDVVDYIKSILPNTLILTNKYINKLECDISIPDLKIAIECNGLYWHSELYKDKHYHLDKKKAIEETDYTLLTIWEDDWNFKQDIIKSRLKAKLGVANNKIYARKCIVKQISNKESSEFLNENHLYGNINASIRYGLFYNDELVQVITISKSRKALSKNSNGYELLRMATKKDYIVIGGFSKLINLFKRDYNDSTLYSYVDLSWSNLNGNGYIKAGWKFVKLSENEFWWVNSSVRKPHRENRLKYQKHKISADDSVEKTMHKNKYYRVFGIGNLLMMI